MDTGVIAVIGLCTFLALWYGVGHLVNRRRGQRLFRWLQRGIDVLGGKVETGWIGSPASGARINVLHAAPPFRRLEITLLLANREIAPLWLLEHLRARTDRLIIRATLRSPRRGEVKVSPARGTTHRHQQESWTRQPGPHGLTVAMRGPNAQQQVRSLEPWLQTYGVHLQRFIWHKADPHLQVQMNVSGLLATSCDAFLTDLQTGITIEES
jgi:hypothetical protein